MSNLEDQSNLKIYNKNLFKKIVVEDCSLILSELVVCDLLQFADRKAQAFVINTCMYLNCYYELR